jgi:segregation and condensation protein A
VRRLQEYERYKQAAESVDRIPRLERDIWLASAHNEHRRPLTQLPTVTLQEMIVAFRDVVSRAAMFQHHHVQRERLSVRARMTDVLAAVEGGGFVDFGRLFKPEEGRMGVTVTFIAILELVREGLLDLVQTEPYGPLHVRAAQSPRLRAVPDDESQDEGTA